MRKKITRPEYLKARRVVAAYEKQVKNGKYQFLFWLEGDDREKEPREKYISARNINHACEKFDHQKPSDLEKVDYEVAFKGEFIDISDSILKRFI